MGGCSVCPPTTSHRDLCLQLQPGGGGGSFCAPSLLWGGRWRLCPTAARPHSAGDTAVMMATLLCWKNTSGLALRRFLHRKHDTIDKEPSLISFSSLERGVYFNTSFFNCHELDL